jgi:hypothetical protein
MGDYCRVAWCDQPRGHGSPHKRRLMAVDGATLAGGRLRTVTVSVWLTGESARTPVPLVVVDGSEVALTWTAAAVLSSALHTAGRRYAHSRSAPA